MKIENKKVDPNFSKFLDFLKANPRPLAFFEIKKALRISDDEIEMVALPLTQKNTVYRTFSGRVGLVEGAQIHTGVIAAHPKGFGFVTTEEGLEAFVPPPQMATLIAGDVVEFTVSVSPKDGKEAAEVIRLVSRPESFWLGTLEQNSRGVLFVPDEGLNPFVELSLGSVKAEVGETIQVAIAAGTPLSTRVKGVAVQTLGKRGRPGFDTDYAIAKWLIPSKFDAAGLEQAAAFPSEVGVEDGRRDLRELALVTIDGDSTRDFDDAVYACKSAEGTGYRLVVAIADVAHYVTQESALDVEAAKRGNSVYFPERVIPMLPERLSNELCSLNPGVDRYAMVCDMEVALTGSISNFAFYPAVIRSHARLTYNQVAAAVEGQETVEASLMPLIRDLQGLHEVLRSRRKEAGMLEFNTREPKLVVVDDQIVDIEWYETNVAHHIVEECMLAANRCAANFLKEHGVSPLYRHHAAPEGEDWDESKARLLELGFSLDSQASLAQMSKVLKDSRELENFGVIEENLRKAMKPAIYDTERSSHFSLGFEAYTHFTSPIRRYPDLLVHRAIKAVLLGATCHVFDSQALAESCGLTSRRADRATRFVWNLIKRRHLAKYVGSVQPAKFILGNKRGAKVVLLDFDCAAWLGDAALTAKGYSWDDKAMMWKGPTVLEAGVRISVTIQSADEKDVSVSLN